MTTPDSFNHFITQGIVIKHVKVDIKELSLFLCNPTSQTLMHIAHVVSYLIQRTSKITNLLIYIAGAAHRDLVQIGLGEHYNDLANGYARGAGYTTEYCI